MSYLSINDLRFVGWLYRKQIDMNTCDMEKTAKAYAKRNKWKDKTPAVLGTQQVQN
jgi:hypothetical protein